MNDNNKYKEMLDRNIKTKKNECRMCNIFKLFSLFK